MNTLLFFSIFISFFWLVRQVKAILFWLYLWQLKEYRFDRFFDHFRTDKGKKLFFNFLFIFKVVLFFYALFLGIYVKSEIWQLYGVWILILLFLYFLETVKTLFGLAQKKINKPVLTPKALFLIAINLIFAIIFCFFLYQQFKFFPYWFVFGLLLFDILTAFIVSGIVFILQPFTIYLRNEIIRKAKEKRNEYKDLIVVGITGSYGKTSTKEFLASILSDKFRVLKTSANNNTEIGVAKTILNYLRPEHQIFIVEMGAYKKGEIKAICDIVKPKIGILTGINEQHLALFGSQENIIEAKFELIEALPKDGVAILNYDNKFIKLETRNSKLETNSNGQNSKFKTKVKNKKFYSIKEKTDIWAEDVKIEKEFVNFKIFTKNEQSAEFKINVLGRQNVSNVLGAVAAAKELGMNLQEIVDACAKIKPEQVGMKLFKNKQGINIVDSSYSANPDGVISDLDYLKIWKNNRKVIIMRCLIELGSASKEVHCKIGKKIGEVCDLAIITTQDYFREIKQGALFRSSPKARSEREKSRIESENILFIENPKEIFEKIKDFCGQEDVVLLEGRVPSQLINRKMIFG